MARKTLNRVRINRAKLASMENLQVETVIIRGYLQETLLFSDGKLVHCESIEKKSLNKRTRC